MVHDVASLGFDGEVGLGWEMIFALLPWRRHQLVASGKRPEGHTGDRVSFFLPGVDFVDPFVAGGDSWVGLSSAGRCCGRCWSCEIA